MVVGRISGIFGVQGWVRVYSYTRPPENILEYSPWYIRSASGWLERPLIEGRAHGRGLIAGLEGVSDRDVARAMLGMDVAIRREQLPAPKPGEHYWVDLIGLEVVNREGILLGHVERVMETGANDVLVVKGEREHLIPLVTKVYVLGIDEDHGRIEVDWGADY